MEVGPGEYMLADMDRETAGDCVHEGGSELRKDAGEEGGATKGSTRAGAWGGTSAAVTAAPGTVVSGERTACPIRLFGF